MADYFKQRRFMYVTHTSAFTVKEGNGDAVSLSANKLYQIDLQKLKKSMPITVSAGTVKFSDLPIKEV